MSTYQVGSPCEDCFSCGLQNCLKSFYINLDEQIVKCESSRCMFPYRSKQNHHPLLDTKPTDNILSLDKFLEEKASQIELSPEKIEPKPCREPVEDIPFMFDFTSLFTDNPVKAEDTVKPENCEIKMPTEELKPAALIKDEAQRKSPPKARISRCLSNVKSSSYSKKSNMKKSKLKRAKIDAVLVIEPQSGKAMRPLDLIKHYMQNSNT